eukprot:comp22849_c1_seq1/m.36020 comp22849_c1_seq1/g.36020  ORF comp22849_c1_seq1/g.36020 comp22849_c1_seq1/m.36020 type:complete len:356 (-) comp22849_c1_seq1:288-1355(-)
MGCFLCMSAEERDSQQRNEAIDRNLKKDKAAMRQEVKLLLLGAGESGKSTIVKQMRIIHGDGYSEKDRREFVPIIYLNVVRSIQALLQAAERMGIPLDDQEGEEKARHIMELDKNTTVELTGEMVCSIQYLWQLEALQSTYRRRNEFQLNDSAKYYFDDLDRIGSPEYMPTLDDVLRSRVPTTGIIEFKFQIRDVTYRMVDVGGQRSERRKWIHCFASVTSIIFIVALSEYDQVLFEDKNQSRMRESIALFDNIVNYEWFVDTSMILFLNKTDLFEDKIHLANFNQHFPEYEGPPDDSDAIKIFILNTFFRLNRQPNKTIYSHFTCATDTKNIKFVFAAVRDTILQNNLKNYHLI